MSDLLPKHAHHLHGVLVHDVQVVVGLGRQVEQAAAQSQNTLGGLLGRGFDMLNSQINHGVANNDLKNALNSLTGSFQDSANQALGQNSDLSLNSIGQQVGGQVLNEANNKYDLQSQLNRVQAELN